MRRPSGETLRKGAATRAAIVAAAAEVFNVRGFDGASMSDILAATGLEKGGLYNHFSGKDELALAAFDYAAGAREARMKPALDAAATSREKLAVLVDGFAAQFARPLMRGGCPLMNTAIASTDGHPRLRNRARSAFARMLTLVKAIVGDGIARGEFVPGTDPDAFAAVVVTSLEGALMLSRLYGDPAYLEHVVAYLHLAAGRLAATEKAAAS